jgi:uncharacterized protein (DUF2236 family)
MAVRLAIPRTLPIAYPRDAVRRNLGRVFGVERFGVEQYTDPPGDPGLFGPGSVAWRVHADPSVFVGGISTLMLQSLHPLAAAGVADHSDYRRDPLRRLSRTASFVAATTYGSTEVAERVIKAVRGIHRRVVGVAPDGRAYSAGDPALLRWVHVAEAVSFVRANQRYGLPPMQAVDVDRYYAETAVVAQKLGATDVPRSHDDVRCYLREVRTELDASQNAREMMEFLRAPMRHDPAMWAAHSLLIEAAIDLLPAWARRLHGVGHPPGFSAVAVRPATWSFLMALRLTMGASPALAQAQRRAEAVPAPTPPPGS